MKTEFMMVNPNELVIDMPVDEANVTQKMESLQVNGIIQPITIWLQGMRIIDGFHRTSAAQRLGWVEVPCNVIDCTEDGFWDARIQSAKQHHAISNERLATWIVESWKLTDWYNSPDMDQVRSDYEKFGRDLNVKEDEFSLAKFSTAQTVWGMDFSKKDLSEPEKWFIGKASKWGISHNSIADMLMMALGYGNYLTPPQRANIKETAKAIPLTFAERNAIYPQITKHNWADLEDEKSIVSSWVTDVKGEKFAGPLSGYKKKKVEDQIAQIREENALISQREQQYRSTPAGKADAARIKKDNLADRIKAMRHTLKCIDNPYPLADIPEAPAMLAELIIEINEKIKQDFPTYEKRIPTNPILAENVKLKKQVREQAERIASLERALNAKSMVSRNVVAVSSEELGRIN